MNVLHVENVTLLHARAEDGAKNPALRERFDVAAARAVAPLAVLAEYLLPFVRVGGCALCWKGPALEEELEQGRRAARLLGGNEMYEQLVALLGGRAEEAIPCDFPGRSWEHRLLPIRKMEKTARQYPRKAGTPSKAPLGAGGK